MGEVVVEVKDTIDYELFKKIMNTKTTVHVGHVSGPEVEIAKKLYFGGYSPGYTSPRGTQMRGRNIPARPYLTDGMMHNEESIMAGVMSYYKGLIAGKTTGVAEQIGQMLEQSIIDFVQSNPYAESAPNAKDVVMDKGRNHPLEDTGHLMGSITSRVTH